MCKFEENVKNMKFDNCNLFKRSFTTQGLGYTFNNEKENNLIKENFKNSQFLPNTRRDPSKMKSTSSEYSLKVVIDNNAEEIEQYTESLKKTYETKDEWFDQNSIIQKPKDIAVSLHNPKEPADTKFIPLNSVRIPLGYSTTFLIIPKAREIDESGKELKESYRNCRLEEDTESLEMFNVYTRVACLFECKMKYSTGKCGCSPWNYPVNFNDKVIYFQLKESIYINLLCF